MEDVSIVALLGRLAVSMAVVLALLAVAARLLRRRGLGTSAGSTAASRIEVLARHGLGRTSSVQVVRVGGRTLVLGVTDSTVSVLAEAEPLALEAELALSPAAEQASAPWGPFVEMLKDATARRA